MPQRYLSKTEFESLLQWVAAHGEGYDTYLEWANANNIPDARRHGTYGFASVAQRYRPTIKEIRRGMLQEVRTLAIANKETRISLLWEGIQRLRSDLEGEDISPATRVRIEEQIRKNLESIAKEMGEYNEAPKDDDKPIHQREVERALEEAGLQPRPTKSLIEGAHRVIEEE